MTIGEMTKSQNTKIKDFQTTRQSMRLPHTHFSHFFWQIFATFALFVVLFSSPAHSAESNIVEIMQKLQYDSDLIQKGFSLNRFELVREGITRHKVDFDALRRFNIEVFLTKNNLNYAPIIYSFINNIVEERTSLEYFLSKNQKMKAYEAFQKINHRCMQCHALTRGWSK